MSDIKIDFNTIEELYKVMSKEQNSVEEMMNVLTQFKETIREQQFESSSLEQVYLFLDSLISVMEILSSNMVTLQENAMKIAQEFSTTDQSLASMYGINK
ncbi:hypothetical protein ACFSKI_02925 [Pseudogracilibacillus auburnensis]|uniref:Uncharacterized protein n=1 Tax=Pseudogracilibacillus auburnensis TaxID=1494959 RepID=A0A2V3W1J3_9BACI|nr:hypothetical protein [Pseudogracilibacillus auburnensis]MBO1005990.1 hypothetical protein [Pseudogracilibacillus auburnensis]PXW88137.1 hypothetical protein DFR56_104305 [Pseudogracilibacillus auburnensis]